MADIRDRRPGAGGGQGQIALFHDNGDGTWDLAFGAHLRGWDVTDGAWYRLPVDHSTGALKVYDLSGGGGGGGGGAVTVADGADVAQGSIADAAWSSGSGTVISLLKKIASAGGSAVSIADGSSVTLGTTTDAAVVSDTSGTAIGFLRGLVKLYAARMPVLGQSTKSGSTPVTLASDQGALPITDNSGSLTIDAPAIPSSAGSKLSAASLGVVLASDQAAIPITDNAGSLTVDGTVAVSNSFALDATLTGGTQKSKLVDTAGTNVGVIDSSGALSGNVTKFGGTAVDVSSGNKGSGTLRVTLATDQVQLTNALKVDPSAVTSPVSIATAPALVAGTAEIGRVGLSKTGTGYVPYLADAITTAVTVSGSAGKFGGLVLINLTSAPAYLQVFDTTGAVTLGTTVPTFVIPIPANATAANGVGIVFAMEVGIAMANGIKCAATTTAKGASTVGTGLSGTIYYA